MRVFTPIEAARNANESKYLGVLAAARYARELNALPKDAVPAGLEQKLTTRSLQALVTGDIHFRLVRRRRGGTLPA
jgi:DNA-directed RNA polymerase omega subunit